MRVMASEGFLEKLRDLERRGFSDGLICAELGISDEVLRIVRYNYFRRSPECPSATFAEHFCGYKQ